MGSADLTAHGKRLMVKWYSSSSDKCDKPDVELYELPGGRAMGSYSSDSERTYISQRNSAVITAPDNKNNGDNNKLTMQVIDTVTGKTLHEIAFWHPQLRVRGVSTDGRRVFLTTGYRKKANGNSLVVDFEANRVVATLPTGIMSDGGLYQNGRRAWSRLGRSTWGRSLEYPVTIWDVERRRKIVEFRGDISAVSLDRSESIMFLRHQDGYLEGRDATDGHLLFGTNAHIANVRRAFLMNGRRTLVLLIGEPPRATQASVRPDRELLDITEIRVLDVPTNREPRIEEAKARAARCLTLQEREDNFLPKEPPAWCIEMGKWPYNNAEWRRWLADIRAGKQPPLPEIMSNVGD
jgi:hypothetical protein